MGYRYGDTETIFTTSGGESGSGFTGTVVDGGRDFTRLISQIGAGPGCALGNCCDDFDGYGGSGRGCSGNMLGTIVDIPNNRRAAIVRNTIGSSW